MRRTVLPLLLVSAGCARLPAPPPAGDTAYAREQVALALATPAAPPRDEGRVLREAVAALEPGAAAARASIDAAGETEGLLDVRTAEAQAVVDKARDAAGGDAFLGAAPLDLETVLLATYARNPDVEASRATWRATIRLYDQATSLEDVLLRYRAFARLSSPPVAAKAMGEAAFPYPGVLALKGEMIAAEVRMAREAARMRLRDVLASAAMAHADLAARAEEVALRAELVSLADRVLASARARVRSGTATQAELLEMEAERAMLENDRVRALAAAAEAAARLNSLLARDARAPIVAGPLPAPPSATPDLLALLALAERYAPEPRMARAEAERTAVAIRMAEAMLFAARAPGAAVEAPMAGAGKGSAMPPERTGARGPGRSVGGAMGAGMAPSPGAPLPAASMPGEVGTPATPPAPGAPASLGADLGWIAELRERRVARERQAEEGTLVAARGVATAHLGLDNARRMHLLTSGTTVPLATQAVEERMRLYEAGRSDFAEVFAALRRVVDARLGALAARQMYAEAAAKLWMSAGARPSAVPLGVGGVK